MNRLRSGTARFPLIVRLGLALGCVAMSSLVFMLFSQQLSAPAIALLYLFPVVISATFWGLVAGISASVLSFLAFNYLFIPPYHTFRVTHLQDFLVMVVLLAVAIFISSLMASLQANLSKAEAREKEAKQLYQLSLDLVGVSDPVVIVSILAKRLSEFFNACIVKVEVQAAGQNIKVIYPEESPACLENPSILAPIVSTRANLGNIQIWGLPAKIPQEDAMLIETFANQGALALDTAILSATETRAKILEESDRLKSAILSSVSHELRTPLATIQTAATSLFNANIKLRSEAKVELQTLLLEETDRMIQLVGNLLNMSRIEAGALKLQRQWNSLTEIIDSSTQRIHRLAGSHPLRVQIPDDLPFVWVDSVLIEQVLLNLVSNSTKYAPEQTPIELSANSDSQWLAVTVANQGPPIPDNFLEQVFEKFASVPGMERLRGLGLGLSICKGIVEAHGGKIWATNLVTGVAFTFTLPVTKEGIQPILTEVGDG